MHCWMDSKDPVLILPYYSCPPVWTHPTCLLLLVLLLLFLLILFFIFGCAVVFGILFVPRCFVGTKNAVLHLDSLRHIIVANVMVSASRLTLKKEDERS